MFSFSAMFAGSASVVPERSAVYLREKERTVVAQYSAFSPDAFDDAAVSDCGDASSDSGRSPHVHEMAWSDADVQMDTRGSGRRAAGVETTVLYRACSLIYQGMGLVVATLPLLLPALIPVIALDGSGAWSLVIVAVTTTLALTSLPALMYAVTRPGWTDEPAAFRRMCALWRGWATSVRQFGPLAFLVVACVLGMSLRTENVSGGLWYASVTLVVILGLLIGRLATICALFSFTTRDLILLSIVMSVRDWAGTLFLAALGAVGLGAVLMSPALLTLLWIPLCVLAVPATRRGRQILLEQFTYPQ